jgi:beta-glucanase (GH16 family)
MKRRHDRPSLLAMASIALACAESAPPSGEVADAAEPSRVIGPEAAEASGAIGPDAREASGAIGPDAREASHSGDASDGRRADGSTDAATTAVPPTSVPRDGGEAPVRAGWTLAWSDEFDQAACPSSSNWGFERGFVRNQEAQWYQPDNASCVAGVLVIEARRESKPNPNYLAGSDDWKRNQPSISYTSSSLKSAGKHAFTYGRFEVRARIDTRLGSWPAFWTVGDGAWPGAGEIDIMEFYNATVLGNVCLPMGSTCSWSSARQPLASLGGATWASAFHVWAMEWDAQNIDLFLDDKLIHHLALATAFGSGQANPYLDKPKLIILNQAVGGSNGGDPSGTSFPMRYEVDYVRVYQRNR